MKVTLVMVTSANGRITNGPDPDIYSWTSKEDAKHFFSLLSKYHLIVMGSQTYETAKNKMLLNPQTLRIVMTKHPEKYTKDAVPGQLEFTSEPPQRLVTRLSDVGYKELLLAGGGQINSLFFQAKLVNELLLTIEPVLFGEGKNLLSEIPLNLSLKLTKMKKLNPRGTLLLTYQVI